MNNIDKGTIRQTLEGSYKVAIVDGQTNEVVWQMPDFKKNLILNKGMDAVNTNTYVDCMKNAIAGLGTRLNNIDSATSTITQVGAGITLTPVGLGMWSFTGSAGGYSSQLEAGDVIKYSGGSESTIASVTSNITATATANNNVVGETFVIWKTSQTSLQTEVARGGPGTISGSDSYYLGGAGNCGTTTSGDNMLHLRTYDFPLETQTRNYAEIGVGTSATFNAPNTTFSRILLITPVTASAGQRLRVKYQLSVTVSPTSSVSLPSPIISGWPVAPSANTNASESLQLFHMAIVNTSDGQSDASYLRGYATIEPAGGGYGWLSVDSQPLQLFGTPVNRTFSTTGSAMAILVKPSYTNGSYFCDKVATFTVAQMNWSILRSCGFGFHTDTPYNYDPFDATGQTYAMVFDQNQTKTNTETLALAWRWTWGRTLGNG